MVRISVAKVTLLLFLLLLCNSQMAAGVTYYVSNSSGSDDYDGLSESTPWKSIAKVNNHNFVAGDNVLFQCGDTWRAEMLVIDDSGSAGNPITFTSFPFGCSNKPIFSGAHPVRGWSQYGTNIYVADLTAGNNAGKFPYGINQLFKGTGRLPMGRWPNPSVDDGGVHYHNGYSVIDGQASATSIADTQLPVTNWTGGTTHIKGMRWYILNRDITGTSGTTLTLEKETACWGGSCSGWGYFINNHLATLDQEGEWYHDRATNRIYLYTVSGIPADDAIEGSVILTDDDRFWGVIVLGVDLADHISHVVIDNFEIIRGYRNAISTPTNLETHENSNIVIKNNTIRDMDSTGIKLATWVWNAQDDGVNGWRGGNNLEILNNHIERVNHYGIDTYARHSLFQDNVIKNVGIITNLGKSGLGCGDGNGGHCTEPGDGIRIKVDKENDSGHHNSLIANRLEGVAYNGVDIFGHNNSLRNNYIERSCITKGDCGAVRTFGRDNLTSTFVYDIVLEDNIIFDIPGNTDGAHQTYRALFGFGLYIDNYSKNVEADGNTVVNTSVHGILYQRSTGTVTNNTLYNNVNGTAWGAQVDIGSSPASVTTMQNNVLFGLQSRARTLDTDLSTLSGSDNNYFFNPFEESNISAAGAKTLAEWQAASGMDLNSKKNWYTLGEGESSLSEIFINDTASSKTFDLGNKRYRDLDQDVVDGSLTLQPFTSRVLVFDSLIKAQLSHCVALLQVVAAMTPQTSLSMAANDLDGDGKFGLADAIALLKTLSDDG